MTKRNRIAAFLAAASFAAMAGCAETPTQASTGQYMEDSLITTKVKAAILNDPSLHSTEINVETFKNRVQLSGYVRSAENISQAVAVASRVEGVTSVANDMRLK